MSIHNTPTPWGHEGQVYDLSAIDGVTRTAMSVIASGRAVFQDPNYDGGGRLPDLADELGMGAIDPSTAFFVGISVYEQQFEDSLHRTTVDAPFGHSETDNHYFSPKQQLTLARKGRIYVRPTEDVEIGDDVYIRHTVVNGNDLKQCLGTFGNTDDGGNCVKLEGAVWVQHSAVAGNRGVIELNSNIKTKA